MKTMDAQRTREPGRTDLAIPRLKARHILVPTDFSSAARRAIRYARPLAVRCGARLTLLHVVSPRRYEADYGYGPVIRDCADQQQLTRAARRLRSVGRVAGGGAFPGERLVRWGDTATEILRAARELKTDLIVMGENPTLSALQTMPQQISGGAPCSILVVRTNGAQLIKPRKHA
jgi:universal stress protein A